MSAVTSLGFAEDGETLLRYDSVRNSYCNGAALGTIEAISCPVLPSESVGEIFLY